MVFFDPPEHTRIRRVMSRGISAEVRARVEPIVQQHAAALVERIRHRGRVEIVTELAQELPLFTIATLTGIELVLDPLARSTRMPPLPPCQGESEVGWLRVIRRAIYGQALATQAVTNRH